MTDADPIAQLRTALRRGDGRTAATLLPQLRVAVVAGPDGSARTAVVGSIRVLPVFLSMDSWRAFADAGTPVLLDPDRFRRILDETTAEQVRFDPATAEAVDVPVADVRLLVRGEYLDGAQLRIAGEIVLRPAPELAVAVSEAVRSAGGPTGIELWAMWRVTGGTSAPVLAVPGDVSDEAVAELVSSLRGAALPPDLEVLPLDAAATDRARTQWGGLRVPLP